MANDIELTQVLSVLTEHCLAQNINSCHILYTQKSHKQSLILNNVLQRNTVQFHWFNHQKQVYL